MMHAPPACRDHDRTAAALISCHVIAIEDVRLVALEQSHHAARPVEHARVGRLPHGHIKWVDETPGGVADSERALVQQPLCTSVGSSGPI